MYQVYGVSSTLASQEQCHQSATISQLSDTDTMLKINMDD